MVLNRDGEGMWRWKSNLDSKSSQGIVFYTVTIQDVALFQ